MRSDHRDGLDFFLVEGQKACSVLQQHNSGTRGVQRYRTAVLVEKRNCGVGLITIEKAELSGFPKNASNFVVNRCLRDFAGLERRQQVLSIHEIARWHFKVQSTIRRRDSIMCGAPVGHDDAVEMPLSLNDLS